jgi:superfamily II DNA or RNA helicase
MSQVSRHRGFNDKVLETFQQEAIDCKSTLIFVGTVKAVQALVKTFTDAGIDARHVVGGTDREERAKVIRQFKAGETNVMINCLVL